MKKILLSCLMLLAMACANDDNNNTANDVNNGQDNPSAPVADLLGTWNKECGSVGTGAGFVRNSLTVEAATVTMFTRIFQDSATCAGTADLETRSELKYQVPTYTAGSVNNIDMTVVSIRARFNRNEAVASANALRFCGFGDWQTGVEKEVSGRNCVATLPAAGQPYYDIFRIQNSELFIGQVDAAHDGKSPQTRPVLLESAPFKR